jgi:hypothetical protein
MLKAAVFFAPVAADYVRVPGGLWIHEECIHTAPNGEVADFPECQHPTYSADEWSPNDEPVPNTQCYDQKAFITSSSEFTELNATFVVPPLPTTARGQTVFLWPGFKATEPIIGRPVLQPVLQYGQRFGQNYWELQSWAVGIPSGSITAPAIKVSPGDSLTTYMQLNGAGDTWTIYGGNDRTGEESNLQISKSHAGSQLYTNAVFVSENVMARNHCDYYPANQGIEFKAVSANGQAPGQWQIGYDCGDPDCGQKVIQNSDGTSVQLTWNPTDSVTV